MAEQPVDLAGKVVAITGGGRGIGACLAALLVGDGARVAIGDLDAALAAQTAARLGALGLPLDVTDPAGFTVFLDRVERELGPLDVLVNNAGIMPIGRVEEEPAPVAEAQVAVNFLAVVHGTKEMVRRWKQRAAAGHVVNISSAAGRVPLAGAATYSGTKAAVSAFSNALHTEFRVDGTPIAVTAVHPAIVRTELSAGLTDTRGVTPVTPEQVAAAVVEALRFPRPDVYVPASMGLAVRAAALLPRRVGDWVNKALGGERTALDAIDSPRRKDYEDRVRAARARR
jgi:NAD(P)-dependent dehydrogenase (short-subunit alcohol dehydrogenase family)